MGNQVSEEVREPIGIQPVKTMIAYRSVNYEKGDYMMAMSKPQQVLYLPNTESNTIFDQIANKSGRYRVELLYLEEDIYDVGYLKKKDPEAQQLYYIQDGGDRYTTFEGQVVDKKYVNKKLVPKLARVRADLVQPLQMIPLPDTDEPESETPKPKNGEKLGDYLIRVYRELGMEISIDPSLPTVFFYDEESNQPLNSFKSKQIANRYKGWTLEDINFSLDGIYFLHGTYSFEKIAESGALCDQGNCNEQSFDLKSGMFLNKTKILPRELINEQPGIYFRYLNYLEELPTLDSPFYFKVTAGYGPVGIGFKAEDIFRHYRVNLKGDEDFGYGEELDPMKYFKLEVEPGEAIARTSQVPLSMASFLVVGFGYSEVRYLYRSFTIDGKLQDFTMGDVIDLYRRTRNDHWYIRKSWLIKILDHYGDQPLPALFPQHVCGSTWGIEEITYNTENDIDSDHELFV